MIVEIFATVIQVFLCVTLLAFLLLRQSSDWLRKLSVKPID